MSEYDKRMRQAGGSTRQGGDLDLLKDAVKYHHTNLKKAKVSPRNKKAPGANIA